MGEGQNTFQTKYLPEIRVSEKRHVGREKQRLERKIKKSFKINFTNDLIY